MAVLARITLCAVALVLTAACRTGQEQWGPFHGQVVDAGTGKPIAGAHVMALWVREPPGLHYQQWVYDARETLTDTAGRFEIPYERRWITAWVNAPRIDVFAPGYQMQQPAIATGESPDAESLKVPMRALKTRSERCAAAPALPPLVSRSSIPRYAAALDSYVDGLRC